MPGPATCSWSTGLTPPGPQANDQHFWADLHIFLPHLISHGPTSCWQVTKSQNDSQLAGCSPAPQVRLPLCFQTDCSSQGTGEGWRELHREDLKENSKHTCAALAPVTLSPKPSARVAQRLPFLLPGPTCVSEGRFPHTAPARGSRLDVQELKNSKLGETPMLRAPLTLKGPDTEAHRGKRVCPDNGLGGYKIPDLPHSRRGSRPELIRDQPSPTFPAVCLSCLSVSFPCTHRGQGNLSAHFRAPAKVHCFCFNPFQASQAQ